MKTLYLECNMGAAGDMLTAALYELLKPEEQARFLSWMNALFPGVTLRPLPAVTCGVAGTRMEVTIHGQEEESLDVPAGRQAAPAHHHAGPGDIPGLLASLDLPGTVKAAAQDVYGRIAQAEAAVHGVPVSQAHFHEVGALDAAADITGVCLALYLLRPDRILASPIHLGSGQVRCAHGLLPVPAPATARLLEGIPCYTGEIRGELCTPTGAALIAHFAQAFGPMPALCLEKTGYGIGRKEFPAANCVRAFWGESAGTEREEIVELCCHIDDMTAEALAFAGERLLELGALDVSAAPITMKKGRLGTALTVLCRPRDEDRLAQAVLRETTTNGVRSRRCARHLLAPSARTVETPWGSIRVKQAAGDGIRHEKPEYEDVAAAARRTGLPFREIWEQTLTAMKEETP